MGGERRMMDGVASCEWRVARRTCAGKACFSFLSPLTTRHSPLITAGAFLLTALCFAPRCRAENPVFDLLMSRGVPVGGDEVVRLPPPTLADGLSAAEQRHAVESVAGESHTWEELTRKSVVAPFILRVSKAEARKERRGRRFDVWFIVYGDLRTLDSQDFLRRQFRSATSETDPENGSSSKMLTSSDLKRRGLMSSGRPGEPEYAAVEFTLLDRVRLQVTTQSTKSKTAESNLAASILDRRFMNDAEFPNQWRPITRDDAGRRHLGAPHPYFGFGGYAKATRLIDPPAPSSSNIMRPLPNHRTGSAAPTCCAPSCRSSRR